MSDRVSNGHPIVACGGGPAICDADTMQFDVGRLRVAPARTVRRPWIEGGT